MKAESRAANSVDVVLEKLYHFRYTQCSQLVYNELLNCCYSSIVGAPKYDTIGLPGFPSLCILWNNNVITIFYHMTVKE